MRWMTTQQFTRWRQEQEILRKRRKDDATVLDQLDVGVIRRRKLTKGEAQVSAIEALAFAHFALGLDLPFGIADHEAFSEFVRRKFPSLSDIALWLQVDPGTISEQMAGVRVNRHRETVPAPINPILARALHWAACVGRVNPWMGEGD